MNTCSSFEIFKQITQIPRPSGKEEKMVEFLINFAKENNLKYVMCGSNNVIIFKKATNNSNSTLILQSHIDMVCEKELDIDFDFNSSPIQTQINGDFISACGTTLGADNGVGVAIILHILKSKTLNHCNIEAVFTSQEETTMEGARTLDYSLLKGTALLSLDGTDELCIDSASAGMVVTRFEKEINNVKNNKQKFKLSVTGLTGGHSGGDINKKRVNAIKLIAEILAKHPVTICNIQGGNKDNAIPRDCVATICIENTTSLQKTIEEVKQDIKNLFTDESTNHQIILTPISNEKSLTQKDSDNLVEFLNKLPNGVLEVNENNFPITSCNIAKITTGEKAQITLSLRSSSIEFENKYINLLAEISKKYGFKFDILSKAPFFEENKNSKLIPLCQKIYHKLYGKEVIASPIHAGLEGGVFAKHLPNLDICVTGANLFDIHSTLERASISSIERVEKLVEKIVEEF